MEYLFAALLLAMFIILVCGTVAYCKTIDRNARRARDRATVCFDEQSRLRERLELLEGQIDDLRAEIAHSGSQSATEGKDKTNEQYDRMQAYQPKNYGLNFEGVSDED